VKQYTVYLQFRNLDTRLERNVTAFSHEGALNSALRGVEWFEEVDSSGKYIRETQLTRAEVIETGPGHPTSGAI
jgi:predicted Ser/Thr protein kinase